MKPGNNITSKHRKALEGRKKKTVNLGNSRLEGEHSSEFPGFSLLTSIYSGQDAAKASNLELTTLSVKKKKKPSTKAFLH